MTLATSFVPQRKALVVLGDAAAGGGRDAGRLAAVNRQCTRVQASIARNGVAAAVGTSRQPVRHFIASQIWLLQPHRCGTRRGSAGCRRLALLQPASAVQPGLQVSVPASQCRFIGQSGSRRQPVGTGAVADLAGAQVLSMRQPTRQASFVADHAGLTCRVGAAAGVAGTAGGVADAAVGALAVQQGSRPRSGWRRGCNAALFRQGRSPAGPRTRRSCRPGSRRNSAPGRTHRQVGSRRRAVG